MQLAIRSLDGLQLFFAHPHSGHPLYLLLNFVGCS
jgi:hypothetical protein